MASQQNKIREIEIYVDNMIRNMDKMEIIREGFDYLGDRAKETDFKKRLLINLGCVKVLVDGLIAHPGDESTQRFAFYTIYFLGLIPKFRFSFVECYTIDVILDSFRLHHDEDRLQFNGCAALAQLVQDERAIPLAIILGIEEEVSKCVNLYPNTSSGHYAGTTKSWGTLILSKCNDFRRLLRDSSLPDLLNRYCAIVKLDAVQLMQGPVNKDMLWDMEQDVKSMQELEKETRKHYLFLLKEFGTKLFYDDENIIQAHEAWKMAYEAWKIKRDMYRRAKLSVAAIGL